MATYLQLVNDVLARLRENSVASVSSTPYSILIGKFVNDAKRQVEDAWNWDCLNATLTVTTSAGVSNYAVTGSGFRQKNVNVNDTTNKTEITPAPIKWIVDQQQLTTVTNAPPVNYAWNGSDGTDSKVELFPTPNGTYTIKFNMTIPQIALSADADILTVPSEPVIMGAYARAIVERGEDGGMASSEAYALFKGILSDLIAIESTRFIENDVFNPV